MFTLCILTIITGIETATVGFLFATGVLKRSVIGAVIDITWDILSIIVGAIGYYGIYTIATNDCAAFNFEHYNKL